MWSKAIRFFLCSCISDSIRIIVLTYFILHYQSYDVTCRNSSHSKKTMDVDLKPDPVVVDVDQSKEEDLQSDLMTNKTSSNDTSDSEQAANEIDGEWVADAIKDVAYYLRSHKFNDFDRRYLTDENNTGKIFFEEFPEPPLRTVHWETHKHCENNFTDCLKFLHERVLQTNLKRANDTVTIQREKGWKLPINSKEINETDTQCKALFEQEKNLSKPFLGPLERFQWRTSASYYMCWFTMKQLPQLMLFGEPCDNFSNCLDPSFGGSNKDPRADDRLPFQCAAYSFCPDPCCPKKHIRSLEECWNDGVNPCYEEAPEENRTCVFNSKNNTDFQSLVTNKWNVTCGCSQEGFEWSSRFGICIDVDECYVGKNSCSNISEACFNLPGSYTCGCKWGYVYDAIADTCLLDEALFVTVNKTGDNDGADKLKPISLIKYMKTMRSKSDGHRSSGNLFNIPTILLPLLVAKFKTNN